MKILESIRDKGSVKLPENQITYILGNLDIGKELNFSEFLYSVYITFLFVK